MWRLRSNYREITGDQECCKEHEKQPTHYTSAGIEEIEELQITTKSESERMVAEV